MVCISLPLCLAILNCVAPAHAQVRGPVGCLHRRLVGETKEEPPRESPVSGVTVSTDDEKRAEEDARRTEEAKRRAEEDARRVQEEAKRRLQEEELRAKLELIAKAEDEEPLESPSDKKARKEIPEKGIRVTNSVIEEVNQVYNPKNPANESPKGTPLERGNWERHVHGKTWYLSEDKKYFIYFTTHENPVRNNTDHSSGRWYLCENDPDTYYKALYSIFDDEEKTKLENTHEAYTNRSYQNTQQPPRNGWRCEWSDITERQYKTTQKVNNNQWDSWVDDSDDIVPTAYETKVQEADIWKHGGWGRGNIWQKRPKQLEDLKLELVTA